MPRLAIYSRDMPELVRARDLFQQRRYDEALGLLEEAVRREPGNLQAIADAIRAYGRRYQIARAESLVEHLISRAHGRAEVLQFAGESYLFLHRPALAEKCFEQACRGSGRVLESQVHLAGVYERCGRLDAAQQLVGSALALAPDFDRARIVLAKIQRNRGELTRAESTLRELASRTGPCQAEALGLLSEVLDQQGSYDAAFAAALEGKKLLLPRSEKQREAADFAQARFAAMIRSITPDHFSRWQANGPTSEQFRVAMLTGFPRSGTTLLEQVLDSHSGLVSSEEHDVLSREIFPSLARGAPLEQPTIELLNRLTGEQIAEHRTLYFQHIQALLGSPIGERILLDKNPAMNPMLPVVRRLFPEMKLLVALRDPRDVIVSCFLRYLPLNPVSVCFLTLEQTLQRYALDMDAWLTLRPMLNGGWIEVRYEELVRDLPAQARRALELLDLPWDDSILDYRQRSGAKQVRSPSYADVARPVYSTAIGRWHNYERHLARILPELERFVRAFEYNA